MATAPAKDRLQMFRAVWKREPDLMSSAWVRERALTALVALEESDYETVYEILDTLTGFVTDA